MSDSAKLMMHAKFSDVPASDLGQGNLILDYKSRVCAWRDGSLVKPQSGVPSNYRHADASHLVRVIGQAFGGWAPPIEYDDDGEPVDYVPQTSAERKQIAQLGRKARKPKAPAKRKRTKAKVDSVATHKAHENAKAKTPKAPKAPAKAQEQTREENVADVLTTLAALLRGK